MSTMNSQEQRQHEAYVFELLQTDWQQAFVELYALYSEEIYVLSYIALFHHHKNAEQATRAIFYKLSKHMHTLTSGQYPSLRAHVYAVAVPMLIQQRTDLIFQERERFAISRNVLPVELSEYWHEVQSLSPQDAMVYVLTQVFHWTDNDAALMLQLDVYQVRFRWQAIMQQLAPLSANVHQADLHEMHEAIREVTTLSNRKQKRIIQSILTQKQSGISFIAAQRWKRLFGPIPLGFIVGISIITIGSIVYAQQPNWLDNVVDAIIRSDSPSIEQQVVIKPSIGVRPTVEVEPGLLPVVVEASRSLVTLEGNIYGTFYPFQREAAVADDQGLTPDINIDVPVNEYRGIDQAAIYGVTEPLSQEQLQLLAFDHFASLPLNQFVYVNGTYYTEESDEEFRPLFINFSADGSFEYQMRQAAICKLENLTANIDEAGARDAATDFLRSHNYITEADDVQFTLITEIGKTVPADTFCKDGNETPIYNHQFAVYLPQKSLRYSDGPSDGLPMRLQGFFVEVNGTTVTSMKADPLHELVDTAVRTEFANLRSLQEAVQDLQNFSYAAQGEAEDARRYNRVFPQWNTQNGDDRLKEMTITDVRLEYVFDNLNNLIEPYYVFSGKGLSVGSDIEQDVRMYVAASVNDIELRAPYNE